MAKARRITIQRLLDHARAPLKLDVAAGAEGLVRTLASSRIQKPGLALAGYVAFIHPDRLQVLGQTEISFLATLTSDARRTALRGLLALELGSIAITKSLTPPPELVEECNRTQTPLLTSPFVSSEFIRKVQGYLDDLLAPSTLVHGVLMDVLGVGTLILGKSGIGKSECALDLVRRGHRLVADDAVQIRRHGEDLVGAGSETTRHLMEVRGLGIINVADLFGVAAVRDHKKVELFVTLAAWREDAPFDRLGLEETTYDLLGVKAPHLVLPLRPGRNVASLVEVAARNWLLRLRGHHSGLEFEERLRQKIELARVKQSEEAGAILPSEHLTDEVE